MRRSSRGHGVLGHAPGKLRPRRTSGCTLIGVSSIDQTLTVSKSAYGHPHIQDYGSLVELTADLDLHMVGSVAKIVSLASVSNPIGGGGGGDFGSVPDGGGTAPTHATHSTGGEAQFSPTLDNGGEVLGDRHIGAGPQGGSLDGASSGSTGGAAGGGATGKLPFTGYAAMMIAGFGAALASGGAVLRSKLRYRG